MIEWKPIKKHDLPTIIDGWANGQDIKLQIPAEYLTVRDTMTKCHDMIKHELGIDKVRGKEYQYDLRFALKLYSCLKNQLKFNESYASNDSFWVFLGVNILPDIVFWRWGPGKHERFYKNSRRIWLKVLWWYIHLSWQGSEEMTRIILEGKTTDEIVQLVERSGQQGYRVSLCRAIMRFYGSQGSEFKGRSSELFRRVMKLNTARLAVIEPALYEGQEEGYVKDLFHELIAN